MYRFVLTLIFVFSPLVLRAELFIPAGSEWKYFDAGFPGSNDWNQTGFDDAPWKSGFGGFAYGDTTEINTMLDAYPDGSNRLNASYFRKSFQFTEQEMLNGLIFQLRCDDGAVVYLNGNEIFRQNMPAGPVEYSTTASTQIITDELEDGYSSYTFLPAALGLTNGLNLLAVEVHQYASHSDDMIFDLSLTSTTNLPPSNTRHHRLVWVNDPTTTMTIAWEQLSGSSATVFYGPEDVGRNYKNYPFTKIVDRIAEYRNGEINTSFARLSGLIPDTEYYFVLKDDSGVSERYWFRTAPDYARPFTFAVGGDSRNNRTPRQNCNKLVARLRPMFIAFTGDMIDSDSTAEWNEWLEDWELTISDDGQMHPLLPHRGNHESRGNSTIWNLFDTTQNNYYAISFGGNLLRYYVLNSETTEGGTQGSWLAGHLASDSSVYTHLVAGYHKPMRPHYLSKTEGSGEYNAWAQLFYDHGVDLVCESDTHVMKRTQPLRPFTGEGSDEGFMEDQENGTVYIGEGCWGAPLRTSDDLKDWTMATGTFNGLDWVHVYPDYIEVFTIKADNADSVGKLPLGDVFSLPAHIDYWNPASGPRLVVNHGASNKTSYIQWQLDHWGHGPIPSNSMALADFDLDGYNNMTEFSFGLDPLTPDDISQTNGIVFPMIGSQADGSINISYRRSTHTSLSYRYEFSSDLMNWTNLVAGVDYTESTQPDGDNELVEVEMGGSKAASHQLFIRLVFGVSHGAD